MAGKGAAIKQGKSKNKGLEKQPGKTEQKDSRSAVQLIYDDDDISTHLSKDRKFNWSLARGIEILRAFSGRPSALGNAELAEITQIPKPTVSRLTYTLTQLGFLALNQKTGKFEMTAAILALGYPVLSSMKIRLIARDYLRQLANEVGLSVAIGSRDRSSMIYVDACHPQSMMTLRLDVGNRVDMAKTSLGRAFLWGISDMERDILYSHFERRYGEEWPQLKSAIEQSLRQIDECGFCIVDREWQDDIRGVGVPLISNDGTTIMALNAAGPAFATDIAKLEKDVGPRLVHLSRSLSPMMV